MTVMTALTQRECAALDVLALLPDGWRVGRACWNPGTQRWAVTARAPHPGRGEAPETISGIGDDDLAAMIDLRTRLGERHRGEKLAATDRRVRAAAKAQSTTEEGRRLMATSWGE